LTNYLFKLMVKIKMYQQIRTSYHTQKSVNNLIYNKSERFRTNDRLEDYFLNILDEAKFYVLRFLQL